MTRCRGLRLATLVPVLVVVAASTGCSAPRTPQGFCKVYWEQKHEYLTKYDQAAAQNKALSKSNPTLGVFANLATGFEAIGDVEIIFDKLDQVAPDDIEPDVGKIRDSLKSQADSAGGAYKDPIGTLLGGLVSSLTTAGSWRRVSDYVVAQCGEKGGTA